MIAWNNMDDLQRSSATNLVWNIYKEKSGGEELHWNICKAMAEAVLSTEFPYHGYPASNGLKEEQREVFVPDKSLPPDDFLASGDWPEDFSGENGNYFNKCCVCNCQFTGHKDRIVCKRCYSSPAPRLSEVLVAAPASTESKSSGEILYAKKLAQYSISIPRLDMRSATWEELGERGQAEEESQAQAVEAAVSLRYKKEIADNERLIGVLSTDLMSCQEANERLTTLANENAVLAVEREAESARKDAVIEDCRIALAASRGFVMVAAGEGNSLIEIIDAALARLAQKGQA